jgi:hypothetical protein
MQGGAMIRTGHEHSYARTRTLTDLGNSGAPHGVTGEMDSVDVAPGKTFVAVSGLGGASLRSYDAALHDGETWWASMYTSNYSRNEPDLPTRQRSHRPPTVDWQGRTSSSWAVA